VNGTASGWRLQVRHRLAILLLLSTATVGCSGGVLDPQGPIALAERQIIDYSGRLELLVRSVPAMTVLLVGGVAWIGAHDLDPRKPIDPAVPPDTLGFLIAVVAVILMRHGVT
jgi:cytochrome o ubiquinol oxidase subunit 2